MNDRPSRGTRAWVLPALMILGAAAGIALGSSLGARWEDPALEPLVLGVRLLGTVFLSLLKALIVPLIVTSIVLGVRNMGGARRVARLFGSTVLYFLGTTALAVITGLVVVELLRPGASLAGAAPGSGLPLASAGERSPAQAIFELVEQMFPDNLFAAAVEGNVLGLVVFSLLFGVALSMSGPKGRTLADALDGANQALLQLVTWIVWLAPLGILGLVADRLGRAGGGDAAWLEIRALGGYAASVCLGLLVHAAVTLPLILWLVARRNPLRYASGMFEALLTALGTASSAATLPVTMRCVVEKNRVSARAADFVLPIGTTVNMDGTALYEAVAAVFIARSMGIELSLAQLGLVAVTATLAAIGAAAIPEAGLVTLILVLEAVNLPAEGIGLLLSIDWILDRFRTTVNVWGDSIGAAVIARIAPESG